MNHLKWRRYSQFIFKINVLFLILACLSWIPLIVETWKHRVLIMLLYLTLLLIGYIFTLVFTNYLGINSVLNINETNISQKIKGILWQWKWEEFTNCKFKCMTRTVFGSGGISLINGFIIEFETATSKPNVSFEINENRILPILALCSNENIRMKIEKLYADFREGKTLQ